MDKGYLPVGCPNGSVGAGGGCVFAGAGAGAPNGSVGLAPKPFDEFDTGHLRFCFFF